ncbi:hypothetical protein N7527_006536 [Penicillium freii]|nr:hypothetical protein N7527_006536 [Penicillium freii]
MAQWHNVWNLKGYFESKAAIEDLVRSAGFTNWTILTPPRLYDKIILGVLLLIELERFSHRTIEIEREALMAEQVARAISEASGREMAVDHIPRDMAERLAPSNPQIDSQVWFWERQDGIEPRELEAEFGFKLTTFKEFLTANQELMRETFG